MWNSAGLVVAIQFILRRPIWFLKSFASVLIQIRTMLVPFFYGEQDSNAWWDVPAKQAKLISFNELKQAVIQSVLASVWGVWMYRYFLHTFWENTASGFPK